MLYRNTSLVRLTRRHANAVSIVWGAARTQQKTLQDAQALVDGVVSRFRNVDIVLFPESFLYNGTNAATLNGSSDRRDVHESRQHSLYIIVPIIELKHADQGQDGPKYNTAVLIDRSGAIRGA